MDLVALDFHGIYKYLFGTKKNIVHKLIDEYFNMVVYLAWD